MFPKFIAGNQKRVEWPMANNRRKEESQSNGKDKGSFRFRYMDSNKQFEVQADNVGGENLLEGFRHVANAIAGRTSAESARRLLKNVGTGAPAEVVDEKDEEEKLEPSLPFPGADPAGEGQDEKEQEQEGEVGAPSEKRPRPAARAPKFLDALNV